MDKKIKIFLIFVIFLTIPFNVYAICPNGSMNPADCLGQWIDTTSGASINQQGGVKKLQNPLGAGNEDINVLIGTIINAIMGIVGSLALAMFIYGGFTWMTAAGASERVQKGKDILIWATVGLIVIFSSYALVYFILNNVIKGV